MIKVLNTSNTVVYVNACQVLKVILHHRFNCTALIALDGSIICYTYIEQFDIARQLSETLQGVTP